MDVCQSCGMPLDKATDVGTESNGKPSVDYCRFCYKLGKFTLDVPLEDFIEHQVRIAMNKRGLSEQKARELVEVTIPFLARWS